MDCSLAIEAEMPASCLPMVRRGSRLRQLLQARRRADAFGCRAGIEGRLDVLTVDSVADAGQACHHPGLYLALVELPGLDDGRQVVRVLQHGDVGQRIALDDEQVRPLPGFDGSGLGRNTE